MNANAANPPQDEHGTSWHFVLYKAGDQPSMVDAESTLRHLCERFLGGDFTIDVVDVTDPDAEFPGDVLALPVVARRRPQPERRVIGDLSDSEKAARWLGLTDAHRSDSGAAER